ncbi:MAG: hypothetical protein WD749_06045 [Phycisphaerales bacterium]
MNDRFQGLPPLAMFGRRIRGEDRTGATSAATIEAHATSAAKIGTGDSRATGSDHLIAPVHSGTQPATRPRMAPRQQAEPRRLDHELTP